MTLAMIMNKSIPDVGVTLLFLLGVLLILLTLNDLIEWLMKKPWRRGKPPAEQPSLNREETGDAVGGEENGGDAETDMRFIIPSATAPPPAGAAS